MTLSSLRSAAGPLYWHSFPSLLPGVGHGLEGKKAEAPLLRQAISLARFLSSCITGRQKISRKRILGQPPENSCPVWRKPQQVDPMVLDRLAGVRRHIKEDPGAEWDVGTISESWRATGIGPPSS